MFRDELEWLDRQMHTGAVLQQIRKSVYYSLREGPDDWGAIGHTGPPKRRVKASEDYCAARGAPFADRGCSIRYPPQDQQEQATVKVTAGGITIWICIFCHGHRYVFADSPPPQKCKYCSSTRLTRGVWRRRAA